ncbi:unnamed protein product [marine sediment metagenome]|uniref:HNH nuclease domain-containing protein n=1 Tax=marine sediment metagenome TaxID=412755 RepID=X1MS36_9ZZZZ
MIKVTYERYLKSEWWRKRRSETLKQNPTCFMCKKRATQVHHITYKRLGEERDSDLVSVCKKHHRKLHFKKEEKLTDFESRYEYQKYYSQRKKREGKPWYKSKAKIKRKFSCLTRYSKKNRYLTSRYGYG